MNMEKVLKVKMEKVKVILSKKRRFVKGGNIEGCVEYWSLC